MFPNSFHKAAILCQAGLLIHTSSIAQSSSFVLWGQAQITDRPIIYAAAGPNHYLAIKEGGQVISWGYWAQFGRYNQYPADPKWPTQVPKDLGPAVAVAAGNNHSLALLQDGSVRGWGDNSFGQIDLPTALKGVKSLDARDDNSILILADGKPLVLGDTVNGLHRLPANLPTLQKVVLTTYGDAAAVVTVTGEVVIWGKGYDSTRWKKSGSWSKVSTLAAGNGFVLALNENGTLGIIGDTARKVLNLPDSLFGIKSIAASNLVGAALTEANLIAWGTNFKGEAVKDFHFGKAKVFSGAMTLLTLTDHGELSNEYQSGGGPAALAYSNQGKTDRIRSVSIDDRAAAVVNDSGGISVYRIGMGGIDLGPNFDDSVRSVNIHSAATFQGALLMGLQDGRVMNAGKAHDKYGPNTLPMDSIPVIDLKAGNSHAVALKADGKVHCWHKYNTAKFTLVPDAAQGAIAIASGHNFVLALKQEGSLVAWGDTADLKIAPEDAQGLKAISAMYFHAMGLKRDGTVVVWGQKSPGSLKVPAGLAQVKAVAMGFDFAAALKQDGSVVVWGGLGSSDYSQSDIPGDLKDVEGLFAGSVSLMAVNKLGTASVGIRSIKSIRDKNPRDASLRKSWDPTPIFPAPDRNALGRYRLRRNR